MSNYKVTKSSSSNCTARALLNGEATILKRTSLTSAEASALELQKQEQIEENDMAHPCEDIQLFIPKKLTDTSALGKSDFGLIVADGETLINESILVIVNGFVQLQKEAGNNRYSLVGNAISLGDPVGTVGDESYVEIMYTVARNIC